MLMRRRGVGLEAADWGLAEMGPDLYVLHGAGGRVERAGANAMAILGHASESLAGAGFIERVHLHDRVAFASAIDACLSGGAPSSAQFRLATPAAGDREKWFEIRCTAVGGAHNPGAVVSVTRDITDWRHLQDELEANRQRAESASVAKGLFLANMSHELRTPLNAILGFSELLQSDAMAAMPPERGREYVELIHSSAGHLLNVLNDILDMSKIEAGKYEIIAEPFDLGQCLKTCCAMMRGQGEGKGVTVGLRTESLPEVTADERAIKQIVINLLSNAIKFSNEGGHVDVEAVRVGRNIQLLVTDRGIGISPEHLENLGKPFYQADSRYDRKYQGTGLGLSVVRGLVELHKGRISFSSRRGEGTRVTVVIPVNSAECRPVPAAEQFEVVRLHALAEEPMRMSMSIAREARVAARGGK